MEDSVPESQGMLLPPSNLLPEDGHPKEEEETKSGFHSDQKTKEEIKEEEQEEEGKGGGGLIRNFMSTMASPLGMRTGEAETEDDTNRDEIPKKEGEEGGGILNNIISNLFHHNDDEEQGKKMEVDGDEEEKNKQVKTEGQSNGGVSVIENIVSHLPPSIPDDAVPTADEATILINSLVRD